MPDAYVFPGGAVDPGDGSPPEAFAVAALRELFEEAGMLIARDTAGNPLSLDAEGHADLREHVASGGSLVDALHARGATLDTRALTYYSNWITPETEPVRFDAHFFVARAPEGQEGLADAREVHDGLWLSPGDALARAGRGELTIRFPTAKHLERLAQHGDVDAFLAHARGRTIVPVMPIEDPGSIAGFPNGDDSW